MASTSIKLDPAALRSSASQVKGIASNLESELHSLEQVVRTTADSWEGSAKVSFENAFESAYKKYLTEIKNALDSYAQEMNAYADDEDSLTSQHAQRFDSIVQ